MDFWAEGKRPPYKDLCAEMCKGPEAGVGLESSRDREIGSVATVC